MHSSLPAPDRPRFDRRTEDVGNIVEFGHVNVRVPDQPLAIAFYVVGLGLTRDPFLRTGLDNAWINVGTSQFHLPVGPAQRLRGRVGLVLPDLDSLVARLSRVAPRLAGTSFGFERSGDGVDVCCPWGNRLRIHGPDRGRFGRMQLGMPYLEIDCAAGTAPGIARFYAELLAAPAQLGEDAAGVYARVSAGPDTRLWFRETGHVQPPYDGHHLQVSVADFSGVHRRLLERGLVSEESSQSQYRFHHIVDPASGRRLLELEHEVRSMRHPMYARRLLNRWAEMPDGGYDAGYESLPWRQPPD